MLKYNNYHKHDHMSNIFTPDTNTKPEEYIKKTVEYGYNNYFTTNHGSFGDIFEARTLCDKYGLRCIAGIEGYIVPDALVKDKRNYHIVVIPKTDAARKKMNYVSSRANVEGFYYKPRFFLSDLLALDKDDVFITTACVAGLLKDDDSIALILNPLVDKFGDNVMLEVQSHDDPDQKRINELAIKLSNDNGLKLIAANDSHYIDAAGQQERLELLKGKHINYGSEDSFILDFPTAEVIAERFRTQAVLNEDQICAAINNTLLFDECEEILLDHSIKMPTIYPNLSPSERVDLLKKNVTAKFKEIKEREHISEEALPRYKEGIRYEMKIIEDTNEEVHTADYFLFNERNVDLAVNKYGGVLTRGGRGSCASFYINKILGMTQLDRFKINLPIFPDRFASTARLIENRSLPDIDFNVKEQAPFVAASRELLGAHGCYPMYAPGTMQLGEAFRNVCRSRGMEFDDFNDVGKDIENHLEDPMWKDIIDEANKYVGTIISGSVHPCAHLLTDKNILYEYGVTRLGEALCVLITSAEADEYKVLKNDYLIVKVWKLIDETFKEIDIPIMPANELLDNIENDPRIWNLFKEGLTCTLNQVDSDNGMNQARRYGLSSFEEGAAIAACIRPSFDSWRNQFLDRSPYSTGSQYLDNVLSMTHGYILYQENLMQYFEALGVTPAESIGLIKKISKKKIRAEDFAKLEERLRSNWIANTGSDEGFDVTWKMIQGCMSYGFCSAHAAATSLDMCYGAYLKVNHPYEYYTVCFNNYVNDSERTGKLTKELSYFNISLTGIKFRYSRSKYAFNKETHKIYKGIQSIKYMNEMVGDELYLLKDNNYDSFIDLLIDIENKTSIDSRQLGILIKLNFFSEFGYIEELLQQVDMYGKLKGKKQLKLDKLPELGIPEWLVERYSNKMTEKVAKDFNWSELLKAWVDYADKPEKKIADHIRYELDLLGYIQTVMPKVNHNIYMVVGIKGESSKIFTLYQIKTGDTKTIKCRKKTWGPKPLELGTMIKIVETEDQKRWSKNQAGEWVRLDDTEEILTNYNIL